MTGGRKDRKAKMNGKNGAPVPAVKKRKEAAQHNQHAGLLALIGSLLLLSALAGVHFEPKVRLYLEGEIAGQDVKSDLDILIEDSESTKRKREQVADSQPPISTSAANRLLILKNASRMFSIQWLPCLKKISNRADGRFPRH